MREQPFSLIREFTRAGVALLRAGGEFDMDNHDALLLFLLTAVNDPTVRRIMVDMSGVRFMDSSAVRAMEIGHAAADAVGKQMHGLSLPPNVRRKFEILELHDLFAAE